MSTTNWSTVHNLAEPAIRAAAPALAGEQDRLILALRQIAEWDETCDRTDGQTVIRMKRHAREQLRRVGVRIPEPVIGIKKRSW